MGKIDMTGWVMKEHGVPNSRITVIKCTNEKNTDGSYNWECLCECGNNFITNGCYIRNGTTKSCGCLSLDTKKSRRVNDIGKKFAKIKVQSYAEPDSFGRTMYNCICDCGNELIVSANHLRTGHTKSCGYCGNYTNQLIDMTGWVMKDHNVPESKLTVIETVKINNQLLWKCLCECGRYTLVASHNIRSGHTKSCGYCGTRPTKIDYNALIGKRLDSIGVLYSKLTILESLGNGLVKCQCDCGNITIANISNIRNGHTLSCGCIRYSIGEKLINDILKDHGIDYTPQYKCEDCKLKRQLRFDFCLNINGQQIILEYNGPHHYKPIEYFGGQKRFLQYQEHDRIKEDYCKQHNIPLIIFKYTEYNQITWDYIKSKCKL